MAAVVIELTPGNTSARVFSPFEAKDIIKTLPPGYRAWDKDNRCWLVKTTMIERLTTLLEAESFTVRVVSGSQQEPPPAPSRGSGTWADQMYATLGTRLADAAHKALSRVLHPDTGGSAEAMKCLNAARDHAHGRNHRH